MLPFSEPSLPRPRLLLQVRGLSLVYEGAPLKMEPKLDYIKRKEEERKSRPNAEPAGGAAGGAAAAAAGRKRRAEAEPEGADGEEAAAGEEAEEAEVEVPEYEPGCILAFDFGETEFAEVRGQGRGRERCGRERCGREGPSRTCVGRRRG